MSEFTPWPEGTLVLAHHPDGLPLRTSCRGHIWRIESPAQKVDYGCGWAQAARCLICGGPPTPFLDADWFSTKVDHMEFAGQMVISGCMGEVQATLEHYNEVLEMLNRVFLGGESVAVRMMKDFG